MGGSVGFKCAEDKGALLMLRPKGEEKICQSAGLIKNYLRANHKKWEDFANDTDGLGLDLKAEDIIFVAGVTKTADWGVTAFMSSQNEVEGSISCNLSGIGAASINVRVTNDSAASLWKRAGPPPSWGRPPSYYISMDSTSIASEIPDIDIGPPLPPVGRWPKALSRAPPPRRAVASSAAPSSSTQGVSDLPKADQPALVLTNCHETPMVLAQRSPGALTVDALQIAIAEDVDGIDAAAEFAMMPSDDSKHFDPVDAALDYILKNSNAPVAIASDIDLYELFESTLGYYPRDISGALERLQPRISVDHGAGMIISSQRALRPVPIPAEVDRVNADSGCYPSFATIGLDQIHVQRQ
ncbi:hypothetical protein VTO73DRAFT_4416 [Trametes versicolor]